MLLWYKKFIYSKLLYDDKTPLTTWNLWFKNFAPIWYYNYYYYYYYYYYEPDEYLGLESMIKIWF
jgi:hypothetical protein